MPVSDGPEGGSLSRRESEANSPVRNLCRSDYFKRRARKWRADRFRVNALASRRRGAHPHLSSARVTSGNAAILPEILRRIVDAYRPAQVYLFGSEARGDAGSDSDIDLAVIVRDDAPEHQSTPRMAAEALWGLERGADVVVFRESEFAARRGVVSSLPWTIRREGKLLYGG